MAVPSSSTITLLGLAREKVYDDYSNTRMPYESGTNKFKYAVDGYAWSGASGQNCTIARQTSFGHFPLAPDPDNPTVMQFNPTGNSSYTSTYNSTSDTLAAASNGQTWTFSFWAKSSIASMGISAWIFENKANGNILAQTHTYFTATWSGWTRFSMTRTLNQGLTTGVQVRFDGPSTHPGGTPYILFDGMQLEQASSATTFTMNGPYTMKDLAESGNSGGSTVSFEATNTAGASEPNTSTPHGMDEWYSYNHDAVGTFAQILVDSNGSDPGSSDSYNAEDYGYIYSVIYRVVITSISGTTTITGNDSDIGLACETSNSAGNPNNYAAPGSFTISSGYSTFYIRARYLVESDLGSENTTITVTPASGTADSIVLTFTWEVLGGGEFCFAAGTLITMYDGTYKPIEEIEIGDMVFTQLGNEEVLEVFSPIHDGILEYTFSDETKTKNTADHPYYVIDKGWCSNVPTLTNERYGIETNEFVCGDICVTDSDEQLELVKVEEIDSEFQTYTFSVNSKTYYANRILVHSER